MASISTCNATVTQKIIEKCYAKYKTSTMLGVNHRSMSGIEKCDALTESATCIFRELNVTCGENTALQEFQRPRLISVDDENLCECCSNLRHLMAEKGTALYGTYNHAPCDLHYTESASTCLRCAATPALEDCDKTDGNLVGLVLVKKPDPCRMEMARIFCLQWKIMEHCPTLAAIQHYFVNQYRPFGNPAVTIQQCPAYFNYMTKFYGNAYEITMRVTFNHSALHK
ncbi:hypothetical protein DdX_18392 [Ditylenchus destructor]|uniref:Uncharacterized protein n=1 Tax=Ditylenchus destructor TaxID=166010 RepID=A0AAD4MJV5_9BILA|nr:hypothetical protein DdX_18392 [Ditylenchus destructor]